MGGWQVAGCATVLCPPAESYETCTHLRRIQPVRRHGRLGAFAARAAAPLFVSVLKQAGLSNGIPFQNPRYLGLCAARWQAQRVREGGLLLRGGRGSRADELRLWSSHISRAEAAATMITSRRGKLPDMVAAAAVPASLSVVPAASVFLVGVARRSNKAPKQRCPIQWIVLVVPDSRRPSANAAHPPPPSSVSGHPAELNCWRAVGGDKVGRAWLTHRWPAPDRPIAHSSGSVPSLLARLR